MEAVRKTPAAGHFGGGGMVTSQSPPFAVPVRYMILGVIGFALVSVDFVAQAGRLEAGGALLPVGVALTHALTLGSLLAFVMGAVYQLSTVAFLIPIVGVRVASFNFWLYAISAVGLISSMAAWWTAGLVFFGTLMTLSVWAYCIIVIVSLARTKVRGAMLGFILSAHVYLLLAVLMALLLVVSLRFGVFDGFYTELLATHILFAVGGFFTFLVLGFSFKLLPMFTLSHGFPTSRQKWTLLLCHVSLWGFVSAIWSHSRPVLIGAGILGLAVFINQLTDIQSILKKRLKRKLEPPIRAVLVAVGLGTIGLCFLLVLMFHGLGVAGWQSVISFYLLGCITLTVMGYAYKIVPFFVWTKRYSKPKDKNGKLPVIADLINVHHAWPVFAGFIVGVIVLTSGIALGGVPEAYVGCVFTSLSILLFCIQMLKVIDVTKVGKELTNHD